MHLNEEKIAFESLKTNEIMPGVIQIQDSHEACATLVIGEKSALLLDTMFGVGDLKGLVESLTDLPYIVINSHGHFDHMGGNCQFEEIYLAKDDFAILPAAEYCVTETEKTLNISLPLAHESVKDTSNLRELEIGQEFDLGGLTAKAISLPGHTKGSVGVFLPEKRLLLAGDAMTPQMCLFMDGHQPLDVYQKTLRSLDALEFDQFMLGHFLQPFPKEILSKFMECSKLIGQKKGYALTYQLVPSYSGKVYFYEMRNEIADGPICMIIDKDEAAQIETAQIETTK